mmetsp:Transcript_43036/g.77213  ORF Transcript_43036/g.77213 Transcript_43036/m.77213 type:complete len:258 (-) Transcript_43036:3800-4573(-)
MAGMPLPGRRLRNLSRDTFLPMPFSDTSTTNSSLWSFRASCEMVTNAARRCSSPSSGRNSLRGVPCALAFFASGTSRACIMNTLPCSEKTKRASKSWQTKTFANPSASACTSASSPSPSPPSSPPSSSNCLVAFLPNSPWFALNFAPRRLAFHALVRTRLAIRFRLRTSTHCLFTRSSVLLVANLAAILAAASASFASSRSLASNACSNFCKSRSQSSPSEVPSSSSMASDLSSCFLFNSWSRSSVSDHIFIESKYL